MNACIINEMKTALVRSPQPGVLNAILYISPQDALSEAKNEARKYFIRDYRLEDRVLKEIGILGKALQEAPDRTQRIRNIKLGDYTILSLWKEIVQKIELDQGGNVPSQTPGRTLFANPE